MDTLPRFQGTTVEWHLCPQVFKLLCHSYSFPEVDLFTSQTTTQLPLLPLLQPDNMRGRPRVELLKYVYIFPPPYYSISSEDDADS